MIGLLIVTDGYLARELRSALEAIVGAQPSIAAICLHADDDMEQRLQEMQEAVNDLDTGSGVLIDTGRFGTIATNLAISMMGRPNIDVIAGVNLPMLVKAATMRDRVPLAACADAAQAAGRKDIVVCSQLIPGGWETRPSGARGNVDVSSTAPRDALWQEVEEEAGTVAPDRAGARAALLRAALTIEARFAQAAANEVANARKAGVEVATLPAMTGHGGGKEPSAAALRRA
jgi:PTS system mannose-specific IIA component